MILGFSKYCQRKDTAFPSEVFDDLLKYQDLAIDALVLALMTGSNHTRAMAAFALKKYKTPQVVTILIEASNDQFEEVRIWAVKSLGEIGDKRGLRPLLKRLNDESEVFVLRPHVH
jgi:HEAT repeat protein